MNFFSENKLPVDNSYMINVLSKIMEHLNPIPYGILRLSQLRRWDFYPTPQKTMLKLFD